MSEHISHLEASHDHDHVGPPGRAWLRVAVWISLSIVALWVLLGNHSSLYVAANVRWTLWIASIFSLGLAMIDGYIAYLRGDLPVDIPARLQRISFMQWRTASFGILFLPLAIGLAIPPATLDAGSILAHSGVITQLPQPHEATALSSLISTKELTLLQAQTDLQHGTITQGQHVQLRGFVYHQAGLAPHTALLVRFITLHCVAEAQPLAIVMSDEAKPAVAFPATNRWVDVTGTLTVGANASGQSVAAIAVDTVTVIAVPPDPYLVY